MSLVEARDLFCVYPGRTGASRPAGADPRRGGGRVCVVLGPSGSGKTTLMRVLAGFERPSAGSIVVAGLTSSLSERRLAEYRAETLGYADQHYWRALAGELTAEELVAVPSASRASGATGAPHALLERVGLRERATPSLASSPAASSSGSPSAPPSPTARAS